MKYYQTARDPRKCTYYLVDGEEVIEILEYVTDKRFTVTVAREPDITEKFKALLHGKQLKELTLGSFLAVYNKWLRKATFYKTGLLYTEEKKKQKGGRHD